MQFPVLWAGQVKAWREFVDVQYNLIMRSSHLCIGVTRCQITLFKEQNKTYFAATWLGFWLLLGTETLSTDKIMSLIMSMYWTSFQELKEFFSGTDLNLECLHKKKYSIKHNPQVNLIGCQWVAFCHFLQTVWFACSASPFRDNRFTFLPLCQGGILVMLDCTWSELSTLSIHSTWSRDPDIFMLLSWNS